MEKELRNFGRQGLDALVAIGGEDTLGVAARLYREQEFPVVGVPKTIDNDLNATDYTFGFDTAVSIATEAIDRLHTTAESHNRVMVVEVMGRHTGWIAVHSGIAGGADVILIPEQPLAVEDACDAIEQRHRGGKDFSIVVVSEGYELTYRSGESQLFAQEAPATDQFGHVRLGGVGDALAREIEERTGFETARHGAGTRPARGHADAAGPGARDAVRPQGGRSRARGGVRDDGGAPRRHDRSGVAGGCDGRAEDGSERLVRRRARVLRLGATGRDGSSPTITYRSGHGSVGSWLKYRCPNTHTCSPTRRNPCPGGVGSAAHRHQAQEDFT